MEWSDVAVVVPARLASVRLPEKLRQKVCGQPVLAWTLRSLQALPLPPGQLCVATGDAVLADIARAQSVAVLDTPPDLPSGTHRVAVASRQLPPHIRWVVNVQGDEPLLEPNVVASVLALRAPGADLLTAACPLLPHEWLDPHTVKVVVGSAHRAIWFTRAPEPYRQRDRNPSEQGELLAELPEIQRHLGIYAFERTRLAQWPDLPPCPLAEQAGLEQLAPLLAGWNLRVAAVGRPAGPAVDTAADLQEVRAILTARSSLPHDAIPVSLPALAP